MAQSLYERGSVTRSCIFERQNSLNLEKLQQENNPFMQVIINQSTEEETITVLNNLQHTRAMARFEAYPLAL